MERVRLYPTASQIAHFEKMLDVTRELYNAALEQRITAYRRCGVFVSKGEQCRELTGIRGDDARFKAIYRRCCDAALWRLDRAFTAFFRRLKRGQAPGFPRFQAASRWNTIVFDTPDACRLNRRQTKVKLPSVDLVRLRRGREIPMHGQVMITRKAGRWYALFECRREVAPLLKTGYDVGIDRGVAVTCATSDGELLSLPESLDGLRRRVIVAQRRMSRREKRGKNRAKARLLLARAHERVANVRRNWCHETSRMLVDRYDTIALEKLEVQIMTKSAQGTVEKPGKSVRAKAGLNREIRSAGWSILGQLIAEKAECAARTVIEIDPKNTSRECFSCGVVNKESRRSQSDFVCTACGHAANADTNAARVILKRAQLAPVGSLGALAPSEDLRSALSSGRTRLTSHRGARTHLAKR